MKNIFISSTFIDMQAERDMVQERVLPALRDEARKYGDNVGVIDLRWGVDTSTLETEEGAAKVLQVCLDEIDRSHPYMLIFLGERYGTVMREDQIKKSVRGREDKYTTDDYAKSITALEVEYGALSEKYGDLNRCVICFREPVVHMLDGAEKDLYAEHTEESKRKLEVLKERIKRDLGDGNRLINYSCTWDKSVRQLACFTSDGQPLETVLTNCFMKMFQDDWKEYENLSWQDQEQLSFRAVMESKLRSFVGRESLLEECYQSLVNGTEQVILQGKVGSGKSAIMCKLAQRLKQEGKKVFVFFAGISSASTAAESLVMQMVYYLENLLGIEEHFEPKRGDWEDEAQEKIEQENKTAKDSRKLTVYDIWLKKLEELCLELPEDESVYFCIDALDQLRFDEHVEEMDFLPEGQKVKVVTSCTDEFPLPKEVITKKKLLPILDLSKEDAKQVVRGILSSYSRNTYAPIEAEIMKKKNSNNPLYISLLIQRLNMMDTEELRMTEGEEEIIALGTEIVREMPEKTELAVITVIQNGIEKVAEDDDILNEVLRYLAISRNGLRITDLQAIFITQDRILPTLDMTRLMKYLDTFFCIQEDDRIDFTHKIIRQGLLQGLTDKESIEENIKEHLKALEEDDSLRIHEAMYFARIRKDRELALSLINQAFRCELVELTKEIKNESLVDQGGFYCYLLEQEENVEVLSILVEMLHRLFIAEVDWQKRKDIAKVAVTSAIGMHEKLKDDRSMQCLYVTYNYMGNALRSLLPDGEALSYYEKALNLAEALYEKKPEDKNRLGDLIFSYRNMGYALQCVRRGKEALPYYESALARAQLLREMQRSDANSLRELAACHYKLANALEAEAGLANALEAEVGLANAFKHYEMEVVFAEQVYEKTGNLEDLHALLRRYNRIGIQAGKLGKTEETKAYYQKALELAKRSHERQKNKNSLRQLLDSYHNMGWTLLKFGQIEEAFSYYKEKVAITEQNDEVKEAFELRVTGMANNDVAGDLVRLEQFEGAITYYEKAIECVKELYKKYGDDTDLRELDLRNKRKASVHSRLHEYKKARECYEKAIERVEQLYKKTGEKTYLQELGKINVSLADVLDKLEKYDDALQCFEKDIRCTILLHEAQGDENSLREVILSYKKMCNMLLKHKRLQEAFTCYEKAYQYVGEEELLAADALSRFGKLNLIYRWKDMGKFLDELKKHALSLSSEEKDELSTEIVDEKKEDFILHEIGAKYSEIGTALYRIAAYDDAVSYYKAGLKCAESLYEESASDSNLRDIGIRNHHIGQAYDASKRYEKCLPYYEKATQCAEQLYEKTGSEADLQELTLYKDKMRLVRSKLDRMIEVLSFDELQLKEAPMLTKLVNAGAIQEIKERIPVAEDIFVERTDATGAQLSIGVYGDSINIVNSDGKWDLSRPIAESIIHYNTDGSFYPNVIKGYEHNADYTEWTFYLRKGMRWSDGDDFNADDITFWYYMCHLSNFDTKKHWAALKESVNGVDSWATLTKVSDYEVKWTFVNPKSSADFIESGDFKWCWAPSHYLKDLIPSSGYVENAYWTDTNLSDEQVLLNAKEKGIEAESIKDLGIAVCYYFWNIPGIPTLNSYVLKAKEGSNSKYGSLRILERNPYFWKIDAEGQQLPYCNEIHMIGVANESQAQLLFRSGELDIIRVEAGEIKAIKKDMGDKAVIRTFAGTNWGSYQITFNYTIADPNYANLFANLKFREAMSICVDRTNVSKLLTDGFLLPGQAAPVEGSFGYDEEWTQKWTDYDVPKAQMLLEECGLVKGADGYYDFADGTDFLLNLYTYNETASFGKPYEVLAKYFDAIGIRCQNTDLLMIDYDQKIDSNDWCASLEPHTKIGGLSLKDRVAPFVPITELAEWYGEYGAWYGTKGEEGVEPTGDMKELLTIYEKWKAETDSAKKDEYALDICRIHEKNMWTIAYLESAGSYTLVNSAIQNHSDNLVWADLYQYANIVHYWTLYKNI